MLFLLLVLLLSTFTLGTAEYESVIKHQTFESYTICNGSSSVKRKCLLDQTVSIAQDKLGCVNDSNIRKKVDGNGCIFVKHYGAIWSGVSGFTCNITHGSLYSTEYDAMNWVPMHNYSCFQFKNLKSQFVLQNTCSNATRLSGLLIKLNFTCQMETLNRTYCIVFTLSGHKADSIPTNPIQTTIRTNTTINATVKYVANVTTTGNSSVSVMVVPITGMQVTTQESTTEDYATTKSKGSSKNVILYAILAGSIVLVVLMVCLVYLLCCRKRKRQKASGNDFPLTMVQVEDDVFSPDVSTDINNEPLYAKPKKKKTKLQLFKPSQKTENWSGYDEVGALIEGIYEARECTSSDPDTRYGVSSLYVPGEDQIDSGKDASPKITDDPYETIGKSNSFTPSREIKKPHKEKSGNLKLVDAPQSGDNSPINLITQPPVDSADENSKVSTFKPGNIRIKQQRTAMKRGKNGVKASPVLVNATHEVVSITPPVSKCSSPDLSNVNVKETVESRNINRKEIPEKVNEKTKSYEEIPEIFDTKKAGKEEQTSESSTKLDNNLYEEIGSQPTEVENVDSGYEDVSPSNKETYDHIGDFTLTKPTTTDAPYDKLEKHTNPTETEMDKNAKMPVTNYSDVDVLPTDEINESNKTNTCKQTIYTDVTIADI